MVTPLTGTPLIASSAGHASKTTHTTQWTQGDLGFDFFDRMDVGPLPGELIALAGATALGIAVRRLRRTPPRFQPPVQHEAPPKPVMRKTTRPAPDPTDEPSWRRRQHGIKAHAPRSFFEQRIRNRTHVLLDTMKPGCPVFLIGTPRTGKTAFGEALLYTSTRYPKINPYSQHTGQIGLLESDDHNNQEFLTAAVGIIEKAEKISRQKIERRILKSGVPPLTYLNNWLKQRGEKASLHFDESSLLQRKDGGWKQFQQTLTGLDHLYLFIDYNYGFDDSTDLDTLFPNAQKHWVNHLNLDETALYVRWFFSYQFKKFGSSIDHREFYSSVSQKAIEKIYALSGGRLIIINYLLYEIMRKKNRWLEDEEPKELKAEDIPDTFKATVPINFRDRPSDVLRTPYPGIILRQDAHKQWSFIIKGMFPSTNASLSEQQKTFILELRKAPMPLDEVEKSIYEDLFHLGLIVIINDEIRIAGYYNELMEDKFSKWE